MSEFGEAWLFPEGDVPPGAMSMADLFVIEARDADGDWGDLSIHVDGEWFPAIAPDMATVSNMIRRLTTGNDPMSFADLRINGYVKVATIHPMGTEKKP